MKIIYIHQYFNTPQKTGGTRSYDLASRFVANGHQVILITTTRQMFDFSNNKRWNIIDIDGIEVHILRNDYHNKMSFFRRVISFLAFAVFSSVHILKLKTDIILATSTPLSIAIPAIIKKRLHKTPFIFEVRDVWPEAAIALGAVKGTISKNVLTWFEQFIYKRASAIVALSSDMKNSIVTRCNQIPEITVVPNISELERFEQARKNNLTEYGSPKKIILYAGSVAMVNNIEYVVKLAACLLKTDNTIEFHIYSTGKGNRFEAVKAMAKEKGVLDLNFFLKDAVAKNSLPDIYRNCTAASSFVADIPELWANSANKFFDTLAAGKPIIINHGGWQAEEIRKYNVGFVLDNNEKYLEKTAKDFADYLNNKTLLGLQGHNAYTLAKEKYSLAIAVAHYEKVFKNIMKSGKEIPADNKNHTPAT